MNFQDILKNHGAAFWVDASIRIIKPIEDWTNPFNQVIHNGGMLLVHHSYPHYSNFAFTDPVMYEYWPTDVERQKSVHQTCSCAMLIYNTEIIYNNVLYWTYLCSLSLECCPEYDNDFFQKFTILEMNNMTLFKIRRYDQSMVNLLLSNLFGYNHKIYSGPPHNQSQYLVKNLALLQVEQVSTCTP